MQHATVKTALITGASYGIGYEFALLLAQQQYNLVIVSRTEKKLNEIKQQFQADYGITVHVIAGDLSKPGTAQKVHNQCVKLGLTIDLLINNAGVGMMGRSIEQPAENIESLLNLNILSLVCLCGLFGADMVKRGAGDILNVGSLVGKFPIPYFAIYASSKSYVLNYSLGLRHELKHSGVNVTCLLPGYVKTAFDDNANITNKQYKQISTLMAMSAEKVARAGLRAVKCKKASLVPGLSNKMMPFFTSIISGNMMSRICGFLIKKII